MEEVIFEPMDYDGEPSFVDPDIDTYELARDLFEEWISVPTKRNLAKAADMAEYFSQLEAHDMDVRKASEEIIELHATKITAHSIQVEEPVGVLVVEGMCHLEDAQVQHVFTINTADSAVSFLTGEELNRIPLQEPQLLLQTPKQLYRMTKKDNLCCVRTQYPPLKPFVDLHWGCCVYVLAHEQWYRIYTEEAVKDSPEINKRLKHLNSPYHFTITTSDPRPLRNERIVTFVSGNQKKLREYTSICRQFGKGYYPTVSLDIGEIQGTPREIVAQKAREAYDLVGSPILVEDVSLCIAAFGGAPGPYVKSWLKTLGPQNFNSLIHTMRDRRAVSEVMYCYYAGHESTIEFFVSTLKGILKPKKKFKLNELEDGFNGFFVPEGYDRPIDKLSYPQQLNTGFRSVALREFFRSQVTSYNRYLNKFEPHVMSLIRKKNFEVT